MCRLAPRLPSGLNEHCRLRVWHCGCRFPSRPECPRRMPQHHHHPLWRGGWTAEIAEVDARLPSTRPRPHRNRAGPTSAAGAPSVDRWKARCRDDDGCPVCCGSGADAPHPLVRHGRAHQCRTASPCLGGFSTTPTRREVRQDRCTPNALGGGERRTRRWKRGMNPMYTSHSRRTVRARGDGVRALAGSFVFTISACISVA